MFARQLRRNQTEAEKALWMRLRNRQIGAMKFRRQVELGNYIVDFACFEKRFIIELDGGQHAEALEYDETRTRWLELQGFRVIRFWNNEVLSNMEAVLMRIVDAAGIPLTPTLSREGRGGLMEQA
ncbi:MAG: endonuclease domain-containing protein [Proteobacteria bacterium]|nr:endonuclease domain-containing protein [Pseudomonadota bacterium]